MLLKRLKVLLQTVQENWVGPTRIWAGEGIQYWGIMGVWDGLEVKVGLIRALSATFTAEVWSWWREVVVEIGFWWKGGIVVGWGGASMGGIWWPGGARERKMESSSSKLLLQEALSQENE